MFSSCEKLSKIITLFEYIVNNDNNLTQSFIILT